MERALVQCAPGTARGEQPGLVRGQRGGLGPVAARNRARGSTGRPGGCRPPGALAGVTRVSACVSPRCWHQAQGETKMWCRHPVLCCRVLVQRALASRHCWGGDTHTRAPEEPGGKARLASGRCFRT